MQLSATRNDGSVTLASQTRHPPTSTLREFHPPNSQRVPPVKQNRPHHPPSIAFTDPMLTRRNAGTTLMFDSDNNGERVRNVALSVDIFSESGERVASYSKPIARIFPGCSTPHTFSIGTLAEGCYNALVIGDAGDNDLFAANFKLKV